MAAIHMSEAEVAQNFSAVLAKVKQGIEIIIEQNHQPIAVVRPAQIKGRLLSECIAMAKARGTSAVPDAGFMKDVEEGIAKRSKLWNPPSWE